MSAFSTIDGDEDVQDIALTNEILSALMERCKAVDAAYTSGASGKYFDPLVGGEDAQSRRTIAPGDPPGVFSWWVLQKLIEDIAVQFADHTLADGGGSFDGTSTTIPLFTKTRFFAAAGFTDTTNGWRRATSWDPSSNVWTDPTDSMYSAHGRAAAGDIFGPWVLVDLQNALSALKWTRHSMTHTTDSYGFPDSFGPPCAGGLIAASADWATNFAWGSHGGDGYVVGAVTYGSGGGFWTRGRSRATPAISGLYSSIAHTGDVYGLASSSNGELFNPFSTFVSSSFVDIDGLGFLEGKILRVETIASTSAASQTASLVGDITSDPITDSGLACSGGTDGRECDVRTFIMCAKWTFSTSN